MAKPYREGKGWAVRVRVQGESIYLSGFATEAAAKKAAAEQTLSIQDRGRPAHRGAERTYVAQAFQSYATERLPFLKGADQDARRMNAYIRAGGIDYLKVKKIPPREQRENDRGEVVHCVVTLVPHEDKRNIVNSLKRHRAKLSELTTNSNRIRQRLATMHMANIAPYHLQQLVDAMGQEGYSASSIHLEVAQWKRLFNYARKIWLWTRPANNPASGLTMPKIDNARDRVLSQDEWCAVFRELEDYPNRYVAPAIALLLETAMRVSEPLLQVLWSDVDWTRRIVALPTAKGGKRDVPLTPDAMEILQKLHEQRKTDEVFPVSYEAVKKGWAVACRACGLEGVHIHDLRHTAATRFALEFHGNKYILKVITGHKTDSQLERYINIKPDDVSRMMHGEENSGRAPARSKIEKSTPVAEIEESSPPNYGGNVVVGHFGKRKAA